VKKKWNDPNLWVRSKNLSIFLIRKISQLLYLNSNFINRRFIMLTNIRIYWFQILVSLFNSKKDDIQFNYCI